MRRTHDVIEEIARVAGVNLDEDQVKVLVDHSDQHGWSASGRMFPEMAHNIISLVKNLSEGGRLKKRTAAPIAMDEVSKKMIEMNKNSGGKCGVSPCRNCTLVSIDGHGPAVPYCSRLRIAY